MVRLEVIYEGELHTRCHHEPSASDLETDAPRDNQGRGETFSPTDLVATGLGSCMLTTMGIVAKRHDWSLEGARAEIEKHMVADPDRRIGRLRARLTLPKLPKEARVALERAALTCPVAQSLHPDIELETSFDWA